MDVLIKAVRWDDVWPECRPMMVSHLKELKQDDPREPLNPPHDLIRHQEAVGGLLIISARIQGRLVGYSIWHISPSFQTAGLIVGMQAPWYVVPEWRKAGVGMMLWREAKRQLRLRGVKPMRAHYPAEGGGSELGKFFAREGAKVIGTEVALWLEDE